MPYGQVMFASDFHFPDDVLSSIPITANIELPITEDMLSWVHITPLITSKSSDKLVSNRVVKNPIWIEYWRIMGDSNILWEGTPFLYTIPKPVPYGYGAPPPTDLGQFEAVVGSPYKFLSGYSYSDAYFLSRAKYSELGVSMYPNLFYSNVRAVKWTSESLEQIPPKAFNPTVRVGGITNFFNSTFIWFNTNKNTNLLEYYLPQSVTETGWLVYSPSDPPPTLSDLISAYPNNFYSPVPYSTIRFTRNIPDMEYIIGSNTNFYSDFRKEFVKINNKKFNLNIFGTINLSNITTLFDETTFVVEDKIYDKENWCAITDIQPGGPTGWYYYCKFGVRFKLLSSTSSTIIKRIPKSMNPTVYTKFLVTIINPSNNKEIQRYEI